MVFEGQANWNQSLIRRLPRLTYAPGVPAARTRHLRPWFGGGGPPRRAKRYTQYGSMAENSWSVSMAVPDTTCLGLPYCHNICRSIDPPTPPQLSGSPMAVTWSVWVSNRVFWGIYFAIYLAVHWFQSAEIRPLPRCHHSRRPGGDWTPWRGPSPLTMATSGR